MRRGIEQHLMLVLAVQIDERAGGLAQRGAGDEAPSTKARLRPCAETSRRTITSPPSAVSKTACTAAVSSPVRTRSALARPPTSSPTAPTRMDLPAPVSPVSTLKPGRKFELETIDDGQVGDAEEADHFARAEVPSYQMFDSAFVPRVTLGGVCAVPAAHWCGPGFARPGRRIRLLTFGYVAFALPGAGAAGLWDRRSRFRSPHRGRQLAREERPAHPAALLRRFLGDHLLQDAAVPSRRAPDGDVPAGLPQEHQVFRGAVDLRERAGEPAGRHLPGRLRGAQPAAAPRRAARRRRQTGGGRAASNLEEPRRGRSGTAARDDGRGARSWRSACRSWRRRRASRRSSGCSAPSSASWWRSRASAWRDRRASAVVAPGIADSADRDGRRPVRGGAGGVLLQRVHRTG